jgi:hypothetical protein
VSEAAYAAVPHVVAAALGVPRNRRLNYLTFVAFVSHGYDKDPVPADLASAYEAALVSTRTMAHDVLEHERLPDADLPYLFETLAATSGLPLLARILEGFSNEEFNITCRRCTATLYISTSSLPFVTYAQDPVRNASSKGVAIHPPADVSVALSSSVPERGSDALPWLLSLSQLQPNPEFRDKLINLYGSGQCPNCEQVFDLYDELEREEPEASATSK